MSHYTRAELKVIKDLSLSDSVVAEQLGRSKQAIYCKRWSMKHRRNLRPAKESQVEKIVEQVVNKTTEPVVDRVVLGNVTIDLVSRTLTVHF